MMGPGYGLSEGPRLARTVNVVAVPTVSLYARYGPERDEICMQSMVCRKGYTLFTRILLPSSSYICQLGPASVARSNISQPTESPSPQKTAAERDHHMSEAEGRPEAGGGGGGGGGGGDVPAATTGAAAAAAIGSLRSTNMTSGAPCGACKFLRRKCIKGSCIFAPYFGSDQGAARFAAVHKIFGASNVSKLLLRIPPVPELRREAVLTISYEAQARISDPIYGCVATIFALEQQVARLQAELAIVQAQLASRLATSSFHNPQQQHHHASNDGTSISAQLYPYAANPLSSSSSCTGYTRVKNETGVGFSIASTCASYSRVKDESCAGFNFMNYDVDMIPNLEQFPSNQQQTDSQVPKNRFGNLDIQQNGMNEGDLQALAHVLLHRN